ncbi:phosphatase PAP2 family protein [Halosolutus gelatinilyticus]|uniref:phosphatase PAP2 family protein n=1 Tax=Halosolutus gelatinilyticus TaxID=2931975 RepID=UPI001FF2B8F3|nr:phosphatase PAP2 family protein [Halosolutus gelatinilyticus]
MLAEVLARVVAVVGVALPLAIAIFVGLERLKRTHTEWRARLRTSAPVIVILSIVLVCNRIMRRAGPSISRDIGIHVNFYEIEGEFVLLFQRIASSEMNTYFTVAYVYGYTFLLIFPVIAYFALSNTRPFRRLLTAYSLNYAIGVVLYVLIVAYGPRNYMPELVSETMLYDNSPQFQYLTQEVNDRRNVFPSLHTSLSMTVACFAYATRDEYPSWLPVAVGLALSIVVSTMYLGIHWGIDVAAGIALALVSVAASDRLVDRWSLRDLRDAVASVRTTVDRQLDR